MPLTAHNYSYGQLVALAKSAGLPSDKANIAAAIALAESSGNPSAHTLDSDDDSYGLWQINMLGSMGPARRATYGLKSNNDLLDPGVNARVMSSMSKQGQNFNPWTTYTSGKYKQYLQSGSSVGNDVVGGLLGPLGGGLAGAGQSAYDTSKATVVALTEVATALEKGGLWISNPSNWVRIAYVAVGAAAVVSGLLAVINSTETGRAIIKQTSKAAAAAAV